MNKIRPLLFVFVQFLLLQLAVFNWGVVSGCGSASTGTSTSSVSDDTNLVTGSPVPIPAPIAKAQGLEGVDPQSLQFVSKQNSESVGGLMKGVTTAKAATTSTSTIGTLTGSVLDQSGGEKTVVVYYNDAVQASAETTKFVFSVDIPDTLVDQSLGLVVLSDDSTVNNIVSVSSPVVLKISAPDAYITTYQLSVGLTNLSATTSGLSTSVGDILNSGLAFSGDGLIAFTSQASDGTYNINTVSESGGAYADLVTGDTIASTLMQYVGASFYSVQSTTGLIQWVDSLGTATLEINNSDIPTARSMAFSPLGGTYIAANRLDQAGDIVLEVNAVAAGPQQASSVPTTLSELLTTSLTFDWQDESKLIVIKENTASDFSAQLYDVSTILAGDTSPITPLIVIRASATPMINPDVDPSGTNFFIVNCRSSVSDTTLDLCVVNQAGTMTTIVSGEYQVTDARYSADGGFIVFDAHFGSDTDPPENNSRVGVYNVATGVTNFVVQGIKPVMSPANNKIIAYLALDSTGALQTNIVNLENLSLP